MQDRLPLFEHMNVLADATRSRILLALERRELAVSELCTVLQLPQSTVSRHLKVLGDDGWVRSRRDGTSRHYSLEPERLPEVQRSLWELAREEIRRAPTAEGDALRIRRVLAERRARSREFFSSSAGRWDLLRRELFGRQSEVTSLLGLLPPEWTVGDLGCGTGRASLALAPFVERVIAVDSSEAMLEEARRRLEGRANVELRPGDLEDLPLADGELDAALMGLVLHHVSDPPSALAETARALKTGGRLLVVDMAPHDRLDYRHEMGHLWLGFGEEQLAGWLAGAGFGAPAWSLLPPDPEAKGPILFAASAVAGAARGEASLTKNRRGTKKHPAAESPDEVSEPDTAGEPGEKPMGQPAAVLTT